MMGVIQAPTAGIGLALQEKTSVAMEDLHTMRYIGQNDRLTIIGHAYQLGPKA